MNGLMYEKIHDFVKNNENYVETSLEEFLSEKFFSYTCRSNYLYL